MLSFYWSSRMTMKMRNRQVQKGVIVQQMKQRWSYYNHSPSGRLLGVEHDYLEVFVSAGCILQEDCTPIHVGGCGGDLSPSAGGSRGQQSLDGGFKGNTLEAKKICKLPCKSIVISSQFGLFIRHMI